MRIDEVVQCAWLMKQSSEHLYFVAKRLHESGLVDYHRAGQMSIECDNAYHAFRLAGSKALGEELFDLQLDRLEQAVKPLEVY